MEIIVEYPDCFFFIYFFKRDVWTNHKRSSCDSGGWKSGCYYSALLHSSVSFPSCSYQTLFFSSSQVCRVSNSQIIHWGTYSVSAGRGWGWWGWRRHLRISFFPACQTNIYTVDTATRWHETKRSISLDLYQLWFTFWKLEIWSVNDCIVQLVLLYMNVRELLFTVTVQCHPDCWVTVLPSDSKRPENCVGDRDDLPHHHPRVHPQSPDGVRSGPAGLGASPGLSAMTGPAPLLSSTVHNTTTS